MSIGLVDLALSGGVRAILGGTLLATWIVGEVVILARYGLRAQQIWLPSALIASVGHGRWRTSEDRGSGLLILLSFYAWAFLTWGTFAADVAILPWYAFYAGLALTLLGIVIRFWALRVLGRHFSAVVSTSNDQSLVTTGPYRLTRHPGYTGVLLISVGLPALMLSGVGLIVGLLLVPAAFGYRMHVEEIALRKRFGSAYDEYSRSTWRVIPYMV